MRYEVLYSPAIRYEVIDSHTGRVVAAYRSRATALSQLDCLDREYGPGRYIVRAAGR